MKSIVVYTDGSCNPVHRIGGWAAILCTGEQKFVLKGKELDTTHQRMELTAILRALEYLEDNQMFTQPVHVYTDSQYMINLPKRRDRLLEKNFLTKKNQPVRNVDLVERLLDYADRIRIEFIKVAAHQKLHSAENLNRDADKLARGVIRDHMRSLSI